MRSRGCRVEELALAGHRIFLFLSLFLSFPSFFFFFFFAKSAVALGQKSSNSTQMEIISPFPFFAVGACSGGEAE